MGLYLEGDLTEGFLRYRFGGLYLEGLIHGGAYFRNFTVLGLAEKIEGQSLIIKNCLSPF